MRNGRGVGTLNFSMGSRYEVEKMGHSDRGANEIFLSNVVKKRELAEILV